MIEVTADSPYGTCPRCPHVLKWVRSIKGVDNACQGEWLDESRSLCNELQYLMLAVFVDRRTVGKQRIKQIARCIGNMCGEHRLSTVGYGTFSPAVWLDCREILRFRLPNAQALLAFEQRAAQACRRRGRV